MAGLPDLTGIRMLLLDADGILTDGGLYVGDDGTSMKRFSIRDGAGIKLLLAAGFKVAVISGHLSPATAARMGSLGVPDIVTGTLDKREAYEALKAKHGLLDSDCAGMGDDIMDLPILKRVRFAASVQNADPEVLKVVHYVTEAAAGDGAVREVADLLLKATGRFDRLLERFA
jgi:3-deoxy-D-manno-octulosonate 8-phosphate phosphatase (KDO 8-P phosphatase)